MYDGFIVMFKEEILSKKVIEKNKVFKIKKKIK